MSTPSLRLSGAVAGLVEMETAMRPWRMLRVRVMNAMKPVLVVLALMRQAVTSGKRARDRERVVVMVQERRSQLPFNE